MHTNSLFHNESIRYVTKFYSYLFSDSSSSSDPRPLGIIYILIDGCSEQTKSRKNAFGIGKMFEGTVFPDLKHFILTYAPTASFK